MAKRKIQFEKQRQATRWGAFQLWLKEKSIFLWRSSQSRTIAYATNNKLKTLAVTNGKERR